MTTLTPTRADQLTGTWNLDAVHSTIGFSVNYMKVIRFRGSFGELEATLRGNEGALALSGSAAVASVRTADDGLFGHLQGPDFFDAEQHPRLQFESAAIRLEGQAVEIDGELTIKGITRPVTLRGSVLGPIEDPYGNDRIGLDLSGEIDRTEWEITWNSPMPGGDNALASTVRLEAELSFVRVAA